MHAMNMWLTEAAGLCTHGVTTMLGVSLRVRCDTTLVVITDLFNISPQVLPLYQRDVMLCLHGSGCVTVRVRRRTAKPPLTPSQWEQAGSYTLTPNVWLQKICYYFFTQYLHYLLMIFILKFLNFNFFKFNNI